MLDQHLNFEGKTALTAAVAGLQPATCTKKLLSELGFAESDFEHPLTEFSGGFQMRVALVRLLLSNPDLLLRHLATKLIFLTTKMPPFSTAGTTNFFGKKYCQKSRF